MQHLLLVFLGISSIHSGVASAGRCLTCCWPQCPSRTPVPLLVRFCPMQYPTVSLGLSSLGNLQPPLPTLPQSLATASHHLAPAHWGGLQYNCHSSLARRVWTCYLCLPLDCPLQPQYLFRPLARPAVWGFSRLELPSSSGLSPALLSSQALPSEELERDSASSWCTGLL